MTHYVATGLYLQWQRVVYYFIVCQPLTKTRLELSFTCKGG